MLSKLRRGYEAMGVDPASVKEHLLSLALEVVHKKMVEMQPVRFGRSWLTDQEGRQKLIRPARYLGHIRPPDSRGRYCLVPWPTAEDVDAFTRWLEQALLREVRLLLEERVDILDDPWVWRMGAGTDALDDVTSSTDVSAVIAEDADPIVNIVDLSEEYETAMKELARHVDAEDLAALVDIVSSIWSGEPAWSRRNTQRQGRLGMKLRQIHGDHPENTRLVHRAWRAAEMLGVAREPLPKVSTTQNRTPARVD